MSEPPPSRWTRFIPRQFSLRALLVVITVAALLLWWSLQPMGDGVTERAARKVKAGMTAAEVQAILGDPIGGAGNADEFIAIYRVKGSYWSEQNMFFLVSGSSKRVFSMSFYADDQTAQVLDQSKAAKSTTGS